MGGAGPSQFVHSSRCYHSGNSLNRPLDIKGSSKGIFSQSQLVSNNMSFTSKRLASWVMGLWISYLSGPPFVQLLWQIFNLLSLPTIHLLENTCLYRIQNIRSGKINRSTSFTIDNMYYVSFWIWEQECVPWCGEIQNRKSKVLGKTFNLHSNST